MDADLAAPLRKLPRQVLCNAGMLFDSIMKFFRVRLYVVQFARPRVEELDQFPVALPDRSGGTSAQKVWLVQWIVPIEGVALQVCRGIFQERQNGNAVSDPFYSYG